MKTTFNSLVKSPVKYISICFFLFACGGDNVSDLTLESEDSYRLHPAYIAFDEAHFDIVLNGSLVTIETNGLPNHRSPYWSNTTTRTITGPNGREIITPAASQDHPLFIPPVATDFSSMSPGHIDDFNGSFSLTVAANPVKANRPSSTGLGPIGIAVSGAVIYNDQEGPNVPLDNAIGSFDYTAAHTGPQSYHYHLEPKAFSNDDENLIGIIADGFFIYGRKCASSGDYPEDLDASGGHTTSTPYNNEAEYHYHVMNELYLNQYYILFPGDYQGNANAIR